MPETTQVPATDVVAAAEEAIPVLRANAQRAERERMLADETIAALERAGVFRMTSPARYGGLEADLQTQIEVLAAVARGCGSAAWVASLYSVCGWFAGLYDDEAQDEVFTSADVRVAGIFSPTGVLTPVDGGYRLCGRWAFNTGCRHAHWDALAARVERPGAPQDGPPELLLALVRMDDVTIRDDWDPSGLAGTASNTTVVEDLFVPAHRTLPMGPALQGHYLSEANRDRPLFRSAFFPFVMANSTGAPVGMAQGAMEATLERMASRGITYTHYDRWTEAPVTHLQVADAQVRLTTAELLAEKVARTVDDAAAAGRELTVAERAAIRGETGHVVRLARETIEILNGISGASSIQRDVPIQRYARDIQALSLHAALNVNTHLEVYGRVLVGSDPVTPFL